jgi:nucleoside-diphosphate-sugar epimerase
MQKIESLLITGAYGFVGSTFLDYLLSLPKNLQPAEIALVTHSRKSPPSKLVDSGIRIVSIEADLTQDWRFEFDCSHLLNLAADGGTNAYSQESNELYLRINSQMIDWTSRNSQAKILHASTGAVSALKPIPGVIFNNSKLSFCNNRLDVENDLLLAAEKTNLNLSIARLYSFIGNNLVHKPQYAVTSFTNSALSDGVIKVTGNKFTTRSYLEGNDLGEWLFKGLSFDEPGIVLDIGSSTPVTMKELAEEIAEQTSAKVEYLAPDSSGDMYIADNLKTISKLGVSEKTHWKDALKSYLEFSRGRLST